MKSNHINPVNPVKKIDCQSSIVDRQLNGFTIIELLVAMALLVILLGLSGMVFNTTVAAHRAAGATIDVARSLSAITGQINADFRGLQKDAPLFIAFNAFDTDGDGNLDFHYDTIHFFALVDFQTTHQYDYDNDGDGFSDGVKTIRGDNLLARVFYGHANTVSAAAAGVDDYADFGALARKIHILVSDNEITSMYREIPVISNWPIVPTVINYDLFDDDFGVSSYSTNYPDENELEFNTITLTHWINALNYLNAGVPLNANHFIANCMTDPTRPMIDLADISTLHLLLAQGVMQMRIQFAYEPGDLAGPVAGFNSGVRWWPDVDPDGDSVTNDSDFGATGMNRTQFGVYFKLPLAVNVDADGNATNDWFAIQSCGTNGVAFNSTFYPKALKFTFVLKDSNGIFADGKTFTYIVNIDN